MSNPLQEHLPTDHLQSLTDMTSMPALVAKEIDLAALCEEADSVPDPLAVQTRM